MDILLSVFPILLLFVLMLGVKMAGHKSAFLTLVATLLIAWLAAPALGFAPENYTQGGVMWAFVEGIFFRPVFLHLHPQRQAHQSAQQRN